MSPADEMAYLRTAWALERTQLAWVRTTLAAIGAGLALAKGVDALNGARLLSAPQWVGGSFWGAVLLALVASLQMAAATRSYVRRDRDLARFHGQPLPQVPALLPMSLATIGLGLATAVLLVVWG